MQNILLLKNREEYDNAPKQSVNLVKNNGII